MSAERIYERLLNEVLEQHFPEKIARGKLLTGLSLKRCFLSHMLQDAMTDAKDGGLEALRRIGGGVAEFLQDRPNWQASDDGLAQQIRLQPKLHEAFDRVFAEDPAAFERYIQTTLERAAETHKARISSENSPAGEISRFNRDLVKGGSIIVGTGLVGYGISRVPRDSKTASQAHPDQANAKAGSWVQAVTVTGAGAALVASAAWKR